MNTKPIIFNSEMVRAILEGRKTQTRRPIKPQPDMNLDGVYQRDKRMLWHQYSLKAFINTCPYGKPGDRLWVRETWRQPEDYEGYERGAILYSASEGDADSKWEPSIHMPRWASRITLEITDIRVERVRDISEEDILEEGIQLSGHGLARSSNQPRYDFRCLWSRIYKDKGFGWNINPWVWVIEFKSI